MAQQAYMLFYEQVTDLPPPANQPHSPTHTHTHTPATNANNTTSSPSKPSANGTKHGPQQNQSPKSPERSKKKKSASSPKGATPPSHATGVNDARVKGQGGVKLLTQQVLEKGSGWLGAIVPALVLGLLFVCLFNLFCHVFDTAWVCEDERGWMAD
eukprot:c15142_g1_i2.p2 GENE.c15142_g1_i2~~c15142_g1_i2.p2  ORF type:complete len:156 (+),score=29.77 c15142_g1_i2:149-616(+)